MTHANKPIFVHNGQLVPLASWRADGVTKISPAYVVKDGDAENLCGSFIGMSAADDIFL
jgi:hypothetical protein